MSVRIFGYGPGVFILAFLWTIIFILFLVFSRLMGGKKLASVILLIIGLVVTLILVMFPREKATSEPSPVVVIYDTTFAPRLVILIFAIVMSLLGLIFYIGNYAGLKLVATPKWKM